MTLEQYEAEVDMVRAKMRKKAKEAAEWGGPPSDVTYFAKALAKLCEYVELAGFLEPEEKAQ